MFSRLLKPLNFTPAFFLSFFLSIYTGTIKFWSLRQGVQFWNFEEKTKTKQKNKNKTKKQKKKANY